jgi:nucleotide-binding universal stress UspA family protein
MAVQRAREQATRAVQEAHALALQACARVQAYFPTWDVHAEAEADSPAWAVIKKADAWQPDLVVVGSHGRSALGPVLLGSVSHKVVTEAHCSVRVARTRRQADGAPVRLVIGADGSADAAAAVHTVAARAWPPGSEARLITAVDARMSTAIAPLHPMVEPWVADSDADESTWVHKMSQTWTEQLRSTGLTVSSIVQEGDPKHVLLDAAEQWEADCIFVGARGLSRVERFLLGSVSTAVATRAPCSVEVIRPRHTS